jgi:hypothetical protein
LGLPLAGQRFTQRGFLETSGQFYPQQGYSDSAHAIGETLLRWEASFEASPSLKLNAAFDARADTHRQFEREWRLDRRDRRAQRPAFSLRRLSALWHKGPVTVEAGKQFIRWGKADILNPTDRFAPRDYLNVTGNEFLAVTAGRVTLEKNSNTLDLVVQPLFTPARTPLLNQRWAVLPEEVTSLPLIDRGTRMPGRTQFGARWSRMGQGYEFSAVFFDGFHNLPLFEGELQFRPVALAFERVPPSLRLYGGDIVVPLRWFTVKSEAAWFTSRTRTADEYVLYVIQLERTVGEWVFVGGYAGESVTERRNPQGFAPDRGLAKALLARAQYTIDPRRSFAFEAAVKESGDGVWLKPEYSQQVGLHWRLTAGFTLIRGNARDFIGQYRLNSHAWVGLRYSF